MTNNKSLVQNNHNTHKKTINKDYLTKRHNHKFDLKKLLHGKTNYLELDTKISLV